MDFLFVSRRMAVMNKTQVGGGVRSTLLIEALSRLGHVDVISFAKEPIESTILNCDVIFSGEIPAGELSLGERLLFNLRLFFTPWSPKGYYCINKEYERIVSRYYNEKHYDFVVCHFIEDAVSCGMMKYAERLILDVDDNLVSAAKRSFANTHIRNLAGWSKAFWRTLSIEKMQRRLLKRVRLSFYSNEGEPPYGKSVLLQNVPLLSCPCADVTEATPMHLLFVGNIDFFPNKNGIVHFVESIFPSIKERIPAVELDIVGLCEDSETKSKLCSVNGVNVLGFVENLQEEYQNCRAVIVPLYHGAGTSIKFIEGVMMNRPIVSTPMGARGFDGIFQANRHYLLASNDQEFADQVVKVFSSLAAAALMARNALKIGEIHFSKNRFYEIVRESVDAITRHQS